MKSSSVFRLLNRFACAAALAFAFVATAPAADLPKFSDPTVNAFVKDYSAYTDESIALNKEVLADPSKATSPKMMALMAKAETMMNQMSAAEAKLKPDEKEKFAKFFSDCSQRMAEGMK